MVVRTPSGGMHLYYPVRGYSEQQSWQAAKAGIDFRGDGGYIIAPSSRVRVDGVLRAYEVVELHADATTPVDAARLRSFLDPRPPERTRALRPTLFRGGGVERIASWVGTLMEGERNRGLFWAAEAKKRGDVHTGPRMVPLSRRFEHRPSGVADGTRTRDILDHNQVLYQLNYSHHCHDCTSSATAHHSSRSSRPVRNRPTPLRVVSATPSATPSPSRLIPLPRDRCPPDVHRDRFPTIMEHR